MLKCFVLIAALGISTIGYAVEIVRTPAKNVTDQYELILREEGRLVVETLGYSREAPRILKWRTEGHLRKALLIWGGELEKGLEGRQVELVTGTSPKKRVIADRLVERGMNKEAYTAW